MIRNDVITKHYSKFLTSKKQRQIIKPSKGFNKSYPKMFVLMNLSHYVKSNEHLCQILACFIMIAH